jgi:hypothetical protein
VTVESTKPQRMQGFRGMERAGLEPATPSLQILLRGGPEGPRVVGGVETSRSLGASSSPLVVACRRDLTRI